MNNINEPVNILMADDDEDDRLLAKEALAEGRLLNNLYFVEDGQELLDFLRHDGKYSQATDAPTPGLILLDLNMPKMDGREALTNIKADPKLKNIPVVILTTSKAEEDIARSYSLGANSFITKPVSFDGLVHALQTLKQYWFEIVSLPTET